MKKPDRDVRSEGIPDPTQDIAIVGRSCRVPGAASVAAFWDLLVEGRCAVTSIPADRWALAPFLHPRAAERGKTYTWAAGVLDDIWSFDPGVFGISPREAVQMDPQQRLLLELTWEALEDAGIRPSNLGGTDAGVFVGASAVDHANLRMLDMSAADAYMMTGNTLSILSNRLSHAFDLHGPSFTIDTACSSSLVAVNEAVANLRSGRIETAIVGGVSILASPQSFVGFAQAGMLSRRGLCQAFSADADGYVRAEGGVVLVLKTRAAAERDGDPVHAFIAGSGVNSDGRTHGISLPSRSSQAQLLETLYRGAGLEPDALAFIETHGTGTPVGDPIEAAAIGEMLGRNRGAPLLIGSVKTNIGHMEAASGLGGLLKAMLALEHDQLPPSLHSERLNPAIDFAALNIEVVRTLTPLPKSVRGRRLAGVNSFGFGGTNAHVILTDAPLRAPVSVATAPIYLVLSSQSRSALPELATQCAARFERTDEEGVIHLAAAMAHRRDHLAQRVVVPLAGRLEMIATLNALRDGEDVVGAARGTAMQREAPVAFVFSGNGCQFVGMGLAAYARSDAFRARIDAISTAFADLAGWSIVDMLHADDLAAQIARTRIAQPLLYAIQSAACHALRNRGLEPAFVLGHSVGEVAAAEAAGILDGADALKVILARSRHQELAFEQGGMAVVVGSYDAMKAILAELRGLDLAAFNSPRAFTVSGTADAICRLPDVARQHQARVRKLDIDYPFHSAGMARIEQPLLRDLADIAPDVGRIPLLSTVEGTVIDGRTVDARYWWRNVREPVRFSEAVEAAVRGGARIFVEVGPKATLLSHISDTIGERTATITTIAALAKKDNGVDPLTSAVAVAISRGAAVDEAKAYGSGPCSGGRVLLPHYPWQRQRFRLPETTEALGYRQRSKWHPLIGARTDADGLEWHSSLDTILIPALADHRLDDQAILPGAAFIEMTLAVARDWLGTDQVTIADIEIQSPMPLSAEASRDVVCRLSPAISQIEILSRPRLSGVPWQSHATAKIVRDATIRNWPDAFDRLDLASASAVEGAEIYAMADRASLHFGPAFRKLRTAVALRPDLILFDLTRDAADPAFGLDPARLDSCFHALILLFSRWRDALTAAAYVPVRLGSITLRMPGVAFTGGRILVTRCDAHVIVADLLMTDDSGGVVACIKDARFHAIRTSARIETAPIVRHTFVLASEPTATRRDPAPTLTKVRNHFVPADPHAPLADGYVLLEGWATSFALRLVRALSMSDRIDVDNLLQSARLPEKLKPWFASLLVALERSGLCYDDSSGICVASDITLPDPDVILRTIAVEHQGLSIELLAASGTMVAGTEIACAGVSTPFARRVIDDFEMDSGQMKVFARDMGALVEAILRTGPMDRAIRILQIGCGPVTRHILSRVGDSRVRLTVFESDHHRIERDRMMFAAHGDLHFVGSLGHCPTSNFDVVIAVGALGRHFRSSDGWASLRDVMAPGAIFIALEPPPALFRDLVLGLDACHTDRAWGVEGRSATGADWIDAIQKAGLIEAQVDHVATDAGTALLLTAQIERARRHWSKSGTALILGDESCRMHTAFATLLASGGLHVSIVRDSVCDTASLAEAPAVIVFFASGSEASATPAQNVLDQCIGLTRLVEGLGQQAIRLWIVTSRRLKDTADPDTDAAAALWAFSRTMANERPSLDIRRVEVSAELRQELQAERLRDLILSETDETDIVLSESATRVLRFDTNPSCGCAEDGVEPKSHIIASCLRRGNGLTIDRMAWGIVDRRVPRRGEVEIAVEAIGLNFRDVMLGLGLLPEDILENGFAGPTLGLECAGRIAHVGAGVKGFQTGDRVVGFAKNAFATHVTTRAAVVSPIPHGFSMEAAATIPVAFVTAYHALISCARLKSGEWVLIHGGAGGVGLAALQVAHWRGARVIATAGTPAKRALLQSLGAEHVFDSRSGAFVADVRCVTDGGVGVVVNSLSGEAMEHSIAILRPAGRFIELGKRDYVANTHIGLRPFHRNLAYFGVDLDQLLIDEPAAQRRVMRSVLRLFDRGDLVPLPYRVFDADETVEAFRLMRQSGHIGKLVVRPPKQIGPVARRRGDFTVSPENAHLITGGFGGFGLETARWLVDNGARTIVLLGRRGAASGDARAAIAALTARGIGIEAASIDVADQSALQKLFARFGRDLPPLAGVIHAAMVLDDALISNLTSEAMARVLRPKVTGADNLDRLTRGMPLDYFILYSSATTLIGNPGQAAYVAANGYIEGLARRRRRAGLTGLAVAWGAIADVGILARSPATSDRLAARAGVRAMKAQDALRHLGQILASASQTAEDDAVVAIAPIDWVKARKNLTLLSSPSYRMLTSREAAMTDGTGQIDVATLVASTTTDVARLQIGGMIVDEIARILRLPREDVARTTSLADIGLDSLMAVELALSLSSRFKLDTPIATTASTFTVNELADHIIKVAAGRISGADAIAETMINNHLSANAETADVRPSAERSLRAAAGSELMPF